MSPKRNLQPDEEDGQTSTESRISESSTRQRESKLGALEECLGYEAVWMKAAKIATPARGKRVEGGEDPAALEGDLQTGRSKAESSAADN